MAKHVLGRGLGALLGGNAAAGKAGDAAHQESAAPAPVAPKTASTTSDASAAPAVAQAVAAGSSSDHQSPASQGQVLQVALHKIKPSPFQPRKDFTPEAIKELADSIREQGIIQPLVVRPQGDHYELIAGERRWRASQSLNLATVPVLVREATDLTVLELSLIENLQRENLNAIEEAQGYAQLTSQFKLTQEEAALKVGRSRAVVANALRLLKLPTEVQSWIREGRLSVGHAKVILGLPGDEEQYLAAERALKDGLNVRQLEEMVAHWQNPSAPVPKGVRGQAASMRDVHVVDLETRLLQRFGTKVSLRYRQGRGAVEIRFATDDDLERILDIMGVKPD